MGAGGPSPKHSAKLVTGWLSRLDDKIGSMAMAGVWLSLLILFGWSQDQLQLPIFPRLPGPIPNGHFPLMELLAFAGFLWMLVLSLLLLRSWRLMPPVDMKIILWTTFVVGYPLAATAYYWRLPADVLAIKYARRLQGSTIAMLVAAFCGWTTSFLFLPSQQCHLIACLVAVAHAPGVRIAHVLIGAEAAHQQVLELMAFEAGYSLGYLMRSWIENAIARESAGAGGGEGAGGGANAASARAALSTGLRCSITSSLMVDPVSAADGQIYEREAISRWLETHDTSPNTGAVLASKQLVPLPAVRETVAQMVAADAVPADDARDWLLHSGVRAAQHWASHDEAKRLLCRALESGSVAAGYHYALLLMTEAVAAGLPGAVAARARLDAHGSLFVVGGIDEDDEASERMDFLADERIEARHAATWHEQHWSASARLKHARHGAACATLGGQLYVVGGYGPTVNSEAALRSVESLQLGEPSALWRAVPPMASARDGAVCAVLRGKLYVGGGRNKAGVGQSTCECFDPQSQSWSAVPSMGAVRYAAASAVVDGCWLVAGGEHDGRTGKRSEAILRSVERFDPATGKWTRLADMQTARTGAAGAALGGFMYVLGGADIDGRHRSVERLDPATGAWSRVADMSTPRWGGAAVAAGSKLLIVGGADDDCMSVSSTEWLDLTSQTWNAAPSLSVPRARLALTAVVGHVS